MALSGWCSQLGRPNHDGCRVPLECGCDCHRNMAKQSGNRTSERVRYGETERAPSRVFGDPLAEGSNRPNKEAG